MRCLPLGFQGSRHGAHGDAKYNRAKAKRAWRREIGREGASRGSFPFAAAASLL